MTAPGQPPRALVVHAAGPLATVQDLGRPGRSELGVGVSGAADQAALRLANRLLGNDEGAAAVEVTLGGLHVHARGALVAALTGAPAPLVVDGRQVGLGGPVHLADGASLRLGLPDVGLRTYLAVRGGVDVPAVLGSQSRDTLAALGPEPLASGDVLAVGTPDRPFPGVDHAPLSFPPAGEVTVRVVLGPRDDWLTDEARDLLVHQAWEVTSDSDRVGMRLDGPLLARCREDELPSEGLVRGAVQVPPSGRPTIFLSDHPVTGGYPVVAVVADADVDRLAQVRPGQRVRLRPVPPTWRPWP